jgi:hypothetical protein
LQLNHKGAGRALDAHSEAVGAHDLTVTSRLQRAEQAVLDCLVVELVGHAHGDGLLDTFNRHTISNDESAGNLQAASVLVG